MSPEKAKPRKRGRPPGRHSADQREHILDTAENLFALRGYAATSLRDITDASGVTPAMVHYYFGSKHDLLRQVLESVLEPVATALAGMKQSGHAPPAEISRLLSKTIRSHPNMPVLMVREVMLPGGALQQEFLQEMAPRLGGALPEMLAGEQHQGRLAGDLDAGITALLLMALSIFPHIVRNVAGPGLGIAYDEVGLDAIEHHVSRLLERGLLS